MEGKGKIRVEVEVEGRMIKERGKAKQRKETGENLSVCRQLTSHRKKWAKALSSIGMAKCEDAHYPLP